MARPGEDLRADQRPSSESARAGGRHSPPAPEPDRPGSTVPTSGVSRDRQITGIRITIFGMREMQGREVSEEQVDAWVAEAEAGYDVEQLRKRGRPTRAGQAAQVVPVRFTEEEIASLMQRADREHLNRSEAIRRAVREWTTA